MSEPIRILHVFGKINLGGAESRTMDLYRHMDRSSVQFDFIVHTQEECFFDKEIIELGGRIFRVPRFQLYNIFAYRKAWKAFFSQHHEFAAVHGHMTSTAAIYLAIAKRSGIPLTIAHARSAGVDKGLKGKLTRLLRRKLPQKADVLLTCSELAAISVFGMKAAQERAVFVPNAIDAAKFTYNESVRNELRETLRITDRYVIGHVGRFDYAKNHEYLINIFSELSHQKLCQRKPVLLLIGEGEGKQSMKDKVAKLGLENAVLFLGLKKDVWNYYQVFDYYVLPSRYEGLPGTILEAQAAGLRCLMSDNLTKEAIFTELVHTISLQAGPEEWARYIEETCDYKRKDTSYLTIQGGFDVNGQVEKIQHFYLTGDVEGL